MTKTPVKKTKSREMRRLKQISEQLEQICNRLTVIEFNVLELSNSFGDNEALKARLVEQAQLNRHLNTIVAEYREKEKKVSSTGSNQNTITINVAK